MCCFSGPVETVENTNIFARLSKQGTQYVVYQMYFKSNEPNAMILPIPTAANPSEESVRFISLKAYPSFFRDLRRSFPQLNPPPITGRVKSAAEKSSALQVHQVGDFVASVVPQAEDFRRLDPRFSIAPETWAKLPIYNDYSFVVFQLANLEGTPHPMAFEFQTRFTDRVFFPTVHIHDGEVHAEEEFDHQLYCQNPNWDPLVGRYSEARDPVTGWIRSKECAAQTMKLSESVGIIDGDSLIHMEKIQGRQANRDIFAIDSLHRQPQSLVPSWIQGSTLFGLGATVSAASLAWIIHRRRERVEQPSK